MENGLTRGSAGEAVLIRGDGVAGCCCAYLLRQAGIRAVLERSTRPQLPAVLLSEAAIALLADVFGRKDLFRSLPRIRSRVVAWGPEATTVCLPHSAVVVSEQTLLDSLRPEEAEEAAAKVKFRVIASRPLPPGPVEQRFGSRMARSFAVTLREGTGPGCWTEATVDGWLFLIGNGNGRGWLLSVGGADPEKSCVVAEQIAHLGEPKGEFPAFPRIITPLCGRSGESEAWLACGTAAIAFDPLCGDGTAHAVREAILAAAVIRALYAGAQADAILAHYEARLTAGFQRHLAACLDFYCAGGTGPWWKAELSALNRGLTWCAERRSHLPGFRYRLNGYQLEAVDAASSPR
jgi:hypothetical protein